LRKRAAILCERGKQQRTAPPDLTVDPTYRLGFPAAKFRISS
jgi:hypothetical protein